MNFPDLWKERMEATTEWEQCAADYKMHKRMREIGIDPFTGEAAKYNHVVLALQDWSKIGIPPEGDHQLFET